MVGNVSDLAVGRTAGGMVCKERFEDAGTVGVRDVAGTVGVCDVAGTVGVRDVAGTVGVCDVAGTGRVLAVEVEVCVVVVVCETPTGTAEAGRRIISLWIGWKLSSLFEYMTTPWRMYMEESLGPPSPSKSPPPQIYRRVLMHVSDLQLIPLRKYNVKVGCIASNLCGSFKLDLQNQRNL